jgi:hypothetical protein
MTAASRVKARVLAVSLLVVGSYVSLYAAALFGGAMIPYQDPTPKLLVHQTNEIRNAGLLSVVGLAVVSAGAATFWRSLARRRDRGTGRDVSSG